jgi:hypothetical protein
VIGIAGMGYGKVRGDAGHQEPDTLPPAEVEVPRERLSMCKSREFLRLHFDLKLSQRQIARSINIGQNGVRLPGALHPRGFELATTRRTVGSRAGISFPRALLPLAPARATSSAERVGRLRGKSQAALSWPVLRWAVPGS